MFMAILLSKRKSSPGLDAAPQPLGQGFSGCLSWCMTQTYFSRDSMPDFVLHLVTGGAACQDCVLCVTIPAVPVSCASPERGSRSCPDSARGPLLARRRSSSVAEGAPVRSAAARDAAGNSAAPAAPTADALSQRMSQVWEIMRWILSSALVWR